MGGLISSGTGAVVGDKVERVGRGLDDILDRTAAHGGTDSNHELIGMIHTKAPPSAACISEASQHLQKKSAPLRLHVGHPPGDRILWAHNHEPRKTEDHPEGGKEEWRAARRQVERKDDEQEGQDRSCGEEEGLRIGGEGSGAWSSGRAEGPQGLSRVPQVLGSHWTEARGQSLGDMRRECRDGEEAREGWLASKEQGAVSDAGPNLLSEIVRSRGNMKHSVLQRGAAVQEAHGQESGASGARPHGLSDSLASYGKRSGGEACFQGGVTGRDRGGAGEAEGQAEIYREESRSEEASWSKQPQDRRADTSVNASLDRDEVIPRRSLSPKVEERQQSEKSRSGYASLDRKDWMGGNPSSKEGERRQVGAAVASESVSEDPCSGKTHSQFGAVVAWEWREDGRKPFCASCQKSIPPDECAEHEDFHLARALQVEEEARQEAREGGGGQGKRGGGGSNNEAGRRRSDGGQAHSSRGASSTHSSQKRRKSESHTLPTSKGSKKASTRDPKHGQQTQTLLDNFVWEGGGKLHES
eukprot:TRINITY_DN2668_c0_g4_i1.p1 TRINITY_DN2668_c0_g4~~TRINITY_DN2668_c0_g4_i1.p1  ORF type:complete len:604 (-),score=78.43 TRINITY_DN2668_c0_g4_i1:43-1626(-)